MACVTCMTDWLRQSVTRGPGVVMQEVRMILYLVKKGCLGGGGGYPISAEKLGVAGYLGLEK